MQINLSKKTKKELQWQNIVSAIQDRCMGPWLSEIEIPLSENFEHMEKMNLETQELMHFFQSGETLPLSGIFDFGSSLERVEKKGVLQVKELQALLGSLRVSRSLRMLFSSQPERFSKLRESCRFSPRLDKLEESLSWSLDENGELSSQAYPEIKRCRDQISTIRNRIIKRLEKMILKHESIVQDRYHTLREGRFVLPIRAEAQGRIPGIIHGTSDSGATVFLEPESLIDFGNTLKMLQSELEQEELRVLDDLSHEVLFLIEDLRKSLQTLKYIDIRQACARFGIDTGGQILELCKEAMLDLKDAKHPMLVLEKINPVGNDLKLENGHTLVLSGPNAGGKTVLLKMAGLFALMTRAAIPFPCKEGSRCGFFEYVLSDIGDGQSIQSHLSSFSAHIQSVSKILEVAKPHSLVLFDELAGNTDPSEGAAIACAVVSELAELGATVIVTTHYNALKGLNETHQSVENASMGFDLEKMEPTYRIHSGLAGTSSALSMAKRFGLAESTLKKAKTYLPQQAETFEKLVHSLEKKHQELEKSLSSAKQAELESKRKLEHLENSLVERRRRAKNAIQEEKEKTNTLMREVRGQLKEVSKNLRTQTKQEGLVEARKRFKEIQAQFSKSQGESTADSTIVVNQTSTQMHWKVGQTVWVKSLRNEASILELSEQKAKVAAGPLKIWVELEQLSKTASTKNQKEKQNASKTKSTEAEKHQGPFRDNTLDIRGMSVEDALTLAESFADRMYAQDQKVAYILHGIGEGILRDAIRTELAHRSPVVNFVEPAPIHQERDRLSVFHLK